MLDRNRRIKTRPERFQEFKEQFDVIFTVEERIFDQLIEGFKNFNRIFKFFSSEYLI